MQDLSTGVGGLDDVLGGGLTAQRLYLLEGSPGAGKTTLALQFALDGVARGERVLYLTLSESSDELHSVAASHGWTLDGVLLQEMLPTPESLEPQEQSTVFHPSEIELGETTQRILDAVRTHQPVRVVLDSLSELRLLAGGPLRFRRQILALKQFFAGTGCTVLLLDDLTTADRDLQVQSIAHGVLRMEQLHLDFGATRRRLLVVKYRGHQYRSGWHDYKIERGGLVVFPRLVANEHATQPLAQRVASGVAGFDLLLCGGLERGTSTLLVGAPGTGKSTVAAQVAIQAAARGEAAALFIFDEGLATLRARCEGLGLPLQDHLDAGTIVVRQIDPAELSPGELVHLVRAQVLRGARVVVIDSLNGYLNAMPDERFLVAQLHELLAYLGQSGVITLLVGAQHGVIGTQMQGPADVSYLADTVVLLRYYEALGEVRQAISVIKKRAGPHERSIRAFKLDSVGIHVGETLGGLRGVLTGVPTPAVSTSDLVAE